MVNVLTIGELIGTAGRTCVALTETDGIAHRTEASVAKGRLCATVSGTRNVAVTDTERESVTETGRAETVIGIETEESASVIVKKTANEATGIGTGTATVEMKKIATERAEKTGTLLAAAQYLWQEMIVGCPVGQICLDTGTGRRVRIRRRSVSDLWRTRSVLSMCAIYFFYCILMSELVRAGVQAELAREGSPGRQKSPIIREGTRAAARV